jgi:acetyl esterase
MNRFQVAASKLAMPLILRMPERAILRTAGAPPTREGHTLDLRCHWFTWLEKRATVDWSADSHLDERQKIAKLGHLVVGRHPPGVDVREIVLGGRSARAYRPSSLAGKAPTLIFFHGGGWVVGNLDTHDGLCRKLAHRCSAQVIAVDYRLAPEHRFPAAFEDARAAFLDARERAEVLGIDRHRLALAGDSAGGNLAAAVSIALRGDTSPCAQLLLYPVTDLSREHPSYETHRDGLLSAPRMRWFRRHYLGTSHRGEDPRASPLCAPDLRGVAPAVVVTAGFDVLRDEGIAFAGRLREAEVPVHALHYPTLPHGFVSMEAVSHVATAATEEACARFTALLVQT